MITFEQKLQRDLYAYLLSRHEVDERKPEAFDIEARWEGILQSYLPDGVREFADYPLSSLGWMMYIGMAVAQFWDEDWPAYEKIDDLYLFMRDKSGYDLLDEYIRGCILGLKEPDFDTTEALVQECTQQAYTLLHHEQLEPGTESAFRGYVACLHQLYLMGAAVQLHRLGCHMTAF